MYYNEIKHDRTKHRVVNINTLKQIKDLGTFIIKVCIILQHGLGLFLIICMLKTVWKPIGN